MLTEVQLLHKRERKKRRRAARIRVRSPEQEEARIGRMVNAIFEGHQGLKDLYEPLLKAEDERHEQEQRDREEAQADVDSRESQTVS